jgi:CheY-like chemotaxis protein
VTQRPLILIVEDNEANQLLAQAVLELEGYAVELAGSAAEAFEVLRARTPALILMDVQLPGEDGLSATTRIKSDPVWAGIPVVALTAHAMTGDRDLALQAGCAGYISKPIDTRTFGVSVSQFLNGAGRDRQVIAG